MLPNDDYRHNDHLHFKDPAFAGKVGETSSLGVVNFPVRPFLHLSSYLSHLSPCVIKYLLLLSFNSSSFSSKYLQKSSKSITQSDCFCVCYQHYQLNLQTSRQAINCLRGYTKFCQLTSDVVSVEHVDQNVDTSPPLTLVSP